MRSIHISRWLRGLVCGGLGLWLVACGPASNSPAATVVPAAVTPAAAGGYPYPAPLTLAAPAATASVLEPYPGALATDVPAPASIDPALLTPQPGKGAVVGKLVSGSPNGSPILGDLYLGGLVMADKLGAPPLVSLSVNINPKAVARTRDGTFVFSNVAVGTYALVVWTPGNAFIVEPPGEGLKQVVVEAGKLTDLGTIVLP